MSSKNYKKLNKNQKNSNVKNVGFHMVMDLYRKEKRKVYYDFDSKKYFVRRRNGYAVPVRQSTGSFVGFHTNGLPLRPTGKYKLHWKNLNHKE